MNKKMHFIAGLPRSGSTLLTAILNQNPNFHSEISNVTYNYFNSIVSCNAKRGMRTMLTESRVKNTILGMFDGFYKEIDKNVIFNCNRGWMGQCDYLYRLNKDFKMICCVRNLVDILNSFEKVFKNKKLNSSPYPTTSSEKMHITNVYIRTDHLMDVGGIVQLIYTDLKEMYYGPFRDHMLLVEYEQLISDPKITMNKIYNFIEEPYFDHDFNNIYYSNPEYDDDLFQHGMHEVSGKIERKTCNTILPPDIIEKYSNIEFWR